MACGILKDTDGRELDPTEGYIRIRRGERVDFTFDTDELPPIVGQFVMELAAAARYWQETDKREGCRIALKSVLKLIDGISPPGVSDPFDVKRPVLQLLSALQDLERGVVDPVLAPVDRAAGKPPPSTFQKAVQAMAAGLAEKMQATGLAAGQAERRVAEILKSEGFAVGSGDTVRYWRQKLNKAPPDDAFRRLFRWETASKYDVKTTEGALREYLRTQK